MKKKIIISAVIIALIAGFIYLFTRETKTPGVLTLYGNIEIRQTDLSFMVPGQILKMYKEEGDKTEPGELIAELDAKDYEVQYAKSKADVAKAAAVKNDAVSNFERQAPLAKDNTISKLDYDNLLNNKDRAKADFEAAIAARDYAKNQLDYAKLYAPEEGTITVRVVEPGATVAKGQTVYTLSKTKPVWIRAFVNEQDLGNVKYGQSVDVYTDTKDPKTGELRKYKGYVGYISPVAEFTPKTVQSEDLRTDLVYRIRVYIDEIDEFLKQGMPVTIKVDLLSGDKNSENERSGN